MGTALFESSQLVKAYVTGPANISADVFRDGNTGTLFGFVTVNGYLIDVP